MHDVLAFPEKYKVFKEYEKRWFLNHANLTEAEKRVISTYGKRFVVLYDIKCDDGDDTIVMYTEMDYAEGTLYFVSQYIKAIASSMPYKALIILKCKGKIKYYMYSSHSNTNNERRTVVERLYATGTYSLSTIKTDWSHKLFASALLKGFSNTGKADEFYDLWIDALISAAGGAFFAAEFANDNTIWQFEEDFN